MNAEVKVSVIICTYNRLSLLKFCIASIADMKIPAEDFEILVIDNNSSDGTGEFCKGLDTFYPNHNWRYIVETIQGIAFARARGAKEATGNILAYIDDDCLAEPNWLNEIIIFLIIILE